jgi:DNA-binding transcriptional regulator PaaX
MAGPQAPAYTTQIRIVGWLAGTVVVEDGTTEEVAAALGMSKGAVRASLKGLVKAGYLKRGSPAVSPFGDAPTYAVSERGMALVRGASGTATCRPTGRRRLHRLHRLGRLHWPSPWR